MPNARDHASIAAIRILRGANAGTYGLKHANPNAVIACNGFPLMFQGAFFGPKSAHALLNDKTGEWSLPVCRRCTVLVVEALSIRASVDPADVCDDPTWRKDDELNKRE